MLKDLQVADLKDIVAEAERLNAPKSGTPAVIDFADGSLLERFAEYERQSKPLRDALSKLSPTQ